MARVSEKDAVKASTLPPNERVNIMFGMPAGLKALIEEQSDERKIPSAALVREIVANHFSYELPAIQRGGARSKYANDEEREAAKKAKQEERRNLINNLLKLYKDGNLPDDVMAALKGDDEDEDEDMGEDDEDEDDE